MTTMNVKDSGGSVVAVEKPLPPGRAAATASRPVALSNEDKASLDAGALEVGGNLATIASALGTNSGAAVITDANGTIQQYLRGLVKQFITLLGIDFALGGGKKISDLDADLATIAANIISGTLTADQLNPRLIAAAQTFNRATNTTTYTAGDEVSQQAPAAILFTASNVNDAPISVRRFRINTAEVQFAGKNFQAWLYNVSKTPGTDNGAFASTRANLVGTMSGALSAVCSDGCSGVLVPDGGNEIITTPISGAMTISARIKILDASAGAPTASTAFDMVIEGVQGRA